MRDGGDISPTSTFKHPKIGEVDSRNEGRSTSILKHTKSGEDGHNLKATNVQGLKSSARRRTQQGSVEAPNFNLWRSFNRTGEPRRGYHSPTFHIHSMRVHYLYINAGGINNDTKVGVIRDYIRNLFPSVDVLCLLNHKLKGDKVEKKLEHCRKAKKLVLGS